VMEDIGTDAIKTGMLHKANVIGVVAKNIAPYPHIPFVLDPVMFAKGGAALLEENAITILKEKLIPLAYVITPNIPEAEFLSGMKIKTMDDMIDSAKQLLSLGCKAVLLKGGHMDGDTVTDILVQGTTQETYTSRRIDTPHTHGTGCTLASAIATGLAQGLGLEHSVTRARNYVIEAIKHAPKLGRGHGPLGHNFTVKKF
jgi:hydroxymethylpyrimidine/phosphomethylpyrimidine kinase